MQRIFEMIREAGIENVLPLRGDPPADQPGFVDRPTASGTRASWCGSSASTGFRSVSPARPIREASGSALAGSRSPELKIKVDAGVDFLITQMFYRNDAYFAFVERARAAASPCRSWRASCDHQRRPDRADRGALGRHHSARPAADLDRTGRRGGAREVGIAFATRQCRELLERGAPGVHFYTLNQSPATSAILRALRRDHP